MSVVGELEGGSVEPPILPVARFGDMVLPVTESSVAIMAQLLTVVVCIVLGHSEALVYSDCMAKNSLSLGVSSVPLDKLPRQ